MKPAAIDYTKGRISETSGELGRTVGELAYELGKYAPTIAATTAAQASGIGAPMVLAIGAAAFFPQDLGGKYKNGILEGKSREEAREYALTAAIFDTGLYLLANGIGSSGGALARVLDKAADVGISKLALNATGKAALRSGSNILTRGIAEGTGGAVQYNADLLARNIAFGEHNPLDFTSDKAKEQFVLSFAIGAVAEVPHAFGSFKGYRAGYGNLDMYQRAADVLWKNNDLIGNTDYTNLKIQ